MLDALVIAPHPDDAELGMGGSIALMLRAGMAVGILDLTEGGRRRGDRRKSGLARRPRPRPPSG
jgi:LmbE family N-acetylglucosaminyl deacetylase